MASSVVYGRDFSYDVALSFASEQRAYVVKVAAALRRRGIRSFYDDYEIATLWGRDLYEHLDWIYREAARYCVLFASEDYAKKVWTTHERRSAQARALQLNQAYILPVRFDDTEIPGLRPTVVYVDARLLSPGALARLIYEKLQSETPGEPTRNTSAFDNSSSLRIRRGDGPSLSSSKLPGRVLLSDLIGTPSRESLINSWERDQSTGKAIIGLDEHGPALVDFVRDGHNMLVAGATGSGKSELFRTLVASLAYMASPADVNFFFAEYKSESLFRDFMGLPHVAGSADGDSDDFSASFKAYVQQEVARRRQILGKHAYALTYDEYVDRRSISGQPHTPLPRLFILLDEVTGLFAAQPDQIEFIIRHALSSLKLGIHFILGTQRIGGLNREVRSIAELRICLRVFDRDDSVDIIDVPDAASIPSSAPGRAFVRTSDLSLHAIQIAEADCIENLCTAANLALEDTY